MGIEVKWDATKEGLEIGFDAEGERHHSVLPWTRIEEMRQEMVRDIWALVPKITEGVGSGSAVVSYNTTAGSPDRLPSSFKREYE